MENYCENERSVIMTQGEFLEELTSQGDVEYEMLQKRTHFPHSQTDHPPQKVLSGDVQTNLTQAHRGDSQRPVMDGKSSHLYLKSSIEEKNHPNQQHHTYVSIWMAKENNSPIFNQFECQKQIIKHFLFETLINERINIQRFKPLPESCKILVALHLKETLNYDLNEQINQGSSQKCLYQLFNSSKVNSTQNEEQKKFQVKLAFLAECYLYGVRKQIKLSEKDLSKEGLLEVIYRAIVQNNQTSSFDFVSLEEFCIQMEDLSKLRLADFNVFNRSDLYRKLFSKMHQISEGTRQKYYSVKVRKHLSSLIDDSLSIQDLTYRFKSPDARIDLYSNYVGINEAKSARNMTKHADKFIKPGKTSSQ